jgi:hypothetical protein
MAHTCDRRALSGVSVYSGAVEAREATDAREFSVAVDCLRLTAVDVLADRVDVRVGIFSYLVMEHISDVDDA